MATVREEPYLAFESPRRPPEPVVRTTISVEGTAHMPCGFGRRHCPPRLHRRQDCLLMASEGAPCTGKFGLVSSSQNHFWRHDKNATIEGGAIREGTRSSVASSSGGAEGRRSVRVRPHEHAFGPGSTVTNGRRVISVDAKPESSYGPSHATLWTHPMTYLLVEAVHRRVAGSTVSICVRN